MKGIIGKKLGMTQVFTSDGERLPITVVEAGPCRVLARRDPESHGYSALQLGFGKRRVKRVTRPMLGHLKKSGNHETPPARIMEMRCPADCETKVGDEVTVDQFAPGDYVDVVGVTKGRGFQGVVKRWNFGGGRASHGGGWTRKPGSIGMCEWPARVQPGKKMPGHMGNARRTVQNLQIVEVRAEENLLLVKGSVPGPNGGILMVRSAVKK